MNYKLLALSFLIFSRSSSEKQEPPYQPPPNNPQYEHVPALPEGNTGIASRYPGDNGIGADTNVIFADDFESYNVTADLTKKWGEVNNANYLDITTGSGKFFSGVKGLEFKLPQSDIEVGTGVSKNVSPELDSLFLRYYGKFDTAFNVMGSSHNGCAISASYWTGPGSGPGIPANGFNKYLTSYEAGRWDNNTANPGLLNIYIYHPGQRDIWGDHFYPTGRILPFDQKPGDFGPQFVARPDTIPQLGRWYCYELMLKANTPAKRDGRVAMWLDGKLIGDFPNLVLRATNELKIDQFVVGLHAGHNTLGEARKWIDNVVVAKSYIGPVR